MKGIFCILALLAVIGYASMEAGKPEIHAYGHKEGQGPSHLNKDPFLLCEILSKEKTGKSYSRIRSSHRYYETVKRWKCPDGNKIQVVWESWKK